MIDAIDQAKKEEEEEKGKKKKVHTFTGLNRMLLVEGLCKYTLTFRTKSGIELSISL